MFKIGNKVKCIEGNSNSVVWADKIGEIYTVVEPNGLDLRDEHGKLWTGNASSRFILYDPSIICNECIYKCKLDKKECTLFEE